MSLAGSPFGRSFLSRIIARCVAFALMICAVPACGGSDGGGGGDARAADQSATTPRFASADDLLAHINRAITADPIDAIAVMELYDLYYTESALQEKMLAIDEALNWSRAMTQLAFLRFGEGVTWDIDEPPLFPLPPAVIVERTDGRVRAAMTHWDHGDMDLHLVRIGDEWMISGYTLERTPMFDPLIEGGHLDQTAALMPAAAQSSKDIALGIARGEYDSIEEVRQADREAMEDRLREYLGE